jgi:hypothetical protein
VAAASSERVAVCARGGCPVYRLSPVLHSYFVDDEFGGGVKKMRNLFWSCCKRFSFLLIQILLRARTAPVGVGGQGGGAGGEGKMKADGGNSKMTAVVVGNKNNNNNNNNSTGINSAGASATTFEDAGSVHTLFDELDRNGDGVVTVRELIIALRRGAVQAAFSGPTALETAWLGDSTLGPCQ